MFVAVAGGVGWGLQGDKGLDAIGGGKVYEKNRGGGRVGPVAGKEKKAYAVRVCESKTGAGVFVRKGRGGVVWCCAVAVACHCEKYKVYV